MPQNCSGAADQLAPADLISFLKAIPDGRFRRGVLYAQWFLLLVAVLGILSGCRSSRDLEAFAKRHRKALNQALGLDFKRWPSDATFLYLFNKAHLQQYCFAEAGGYGEVLQVWKISQIPGGTEGLDQMVCDFKTLRGSAIETEDGNHLYGFGRLPLRCPAHGLCPRLGSCLGAEGLRHPRVQRASRPQAASFCESSCIFSRRLKLAEAKQYKYKPKSKG